MFSGLTTLLVLMHVMPLPWPHALACAVVKELAARAGGPVCRGPGAAVGAALPGAAASTLKPAIVLTKLICRTLMQFGLQAVGLKAQPSPCCASATWQGPAAVRAGGPVCPEPGGAVCAAAPGVPARGVGMVGPGFPGPQEFHDLCCTDCPLMVSSGAVPHGQSV